jgi:hypothetical protein
MTTRGTEMTRHAYDHEKSHNGENDATRHNVLEMFPYPLEMRTKKLTSQVL